MDSISIKLNGEPKVSSSQTIGELLSELGLEGKKIAVELNRELVPRGEHSVKRLAEGDSVEIVQFVGGG